MMLGSVLCTFFYHQKEDEDNPEDVEEDIQDLFEELMNGWME